MYNITEGSNFTKDTVRGVLLLDVGRGHSLSRLTPPNGFIYLTRSKEAHALLTSLDIPSIYFSAIEDALANYPIPISGYLADSVSDSVEDYILRNAERKDPNDKKHRYPIGDSWWITSYLPREVFTG